MKTMARDISLLQQEQVERLMQIGAYLRHIREEHGFSHEEVAARTLIQARLLKAIEEGKLHQLPEPVYVQGFIRRYADALGLDGSEFAEAFPAEKSLHLESSWKDSPAAQLRPLHLYLAYIALIVASVSLLSYIVGRSAKPDVASVQPSPVSSSAPVVSPTASSPKSAATTPSTQQPAALTTTQKLMTAASPSPVRSDKPVQVDVKLTAQSWMEVEVDGEVKLAEVLAEGTERTWTADRQIRIRSGNAGGVTIAHNGGKSTLMGVPGAVEEKVYSAASTAASSNSDSAANPEASPAATDEQTEEQPE